jgi:hypothetical protein
MKTLAAVFLVAGLFLVTAARADASAAPQVAPPAAAAQGVNVTPAPAAPEQPGTPPPTWQNACVPTCSYYYSFCVERCGTHGIKSFTCTPIPPGEFGCAPNTCVCNFGL